MDRQFVVLSGKRFNVIEVPCDGNCLFAAFSFALVKSFRLTAHLRRETVEIMELMWDELKDFTDRGDFRPYEDYASYVESMSQNGVWACPTEAHALGNIYGKRVKIFQDDILMCDFCTDCEETVNLLYVRRRNHFQCLIEEADDDVVLPIPDPDIHSDDDVSDEDEVRYTYPETDYDIRGPNWDNEQAGPYDYDDDMFRDELPLAFKVNSLNKRVFPVKDLPVIADRRSSLALCSTIGQHYMWGGLYEGETVQGTKLVSLGEFETSCPDCGALYWAAERLLSDLSVRSWCCGKTVKSTLACAAKFKPISDRFVHELYYGKSDDAKHFQQNIREYNNAFCCAIPVTNYTSKALRTGHVVVLNGRVSFECDTTVAPDLSAGQLYFAKMTNKVIDQRMLRADVPLRRHIVRRIEAYLRRHNDLVKTFEMAGTLQKTRASERVSVLVNPHRDGFRVTDREGIANDPEAFRPAGSDFIAAVYIGNRIKYKYDVALFPRGRNEDEPSEIINENNPSIDTMLYPLIHLHAEDPWVDMTVNRKRTKRPRREFQSTICGSNREYYSSRIMERPGDTGVLFRTKSLYQQWLCDAAVKIEDANLNYADEHNAELRVCQLDSLQRFVESECEAMGKNAGRVVIIPGNIQTSERAMNNNYMDSVRISTETRPPTMLLTFTTNPHWPEIVERLRARGLHWDDYASAPDVVVRVYLARLFIALSDIINKGVFGRVLGFSGVHEFTSRMMPHFHCAIILDPADVPSTPEEVDAIVTAEIPSPEDEPDAFIYVMKHMIHRPCDGSSPNYPNPLCRPNGGPCKAGFPFPFQNETVLTKKGPKLRRRETQPVWSIKWKCYVDNRWVVPCSLRMGLRHGNHMNVMLSGENQCFKYLYGYFTKESRGQCVQGGMLRYFREAGSDSQSNNTDDVLDWDEIQYYKDMRVIGPFEAIFKILGEPTARLSHSVKNLAIHLPDKHCIYYKGSARVAYEAGFRSPLMGWFELNQQDPAARHLLYAQVVTHYKWEGGQWLPKSRGNTLGRLMVVNPSPRNMELFFLRLLLLNRPGMKSFHDVLTVDGISYETFGEACRALGIGNADSLDYSSAMEEVASHGASYQIRQFFATVIATCDIGNTEELWMNHRVSMSNDYVRRGCSRREAFIRARRDILRQVDRMLGDLPMVVNVPPNNYEDSFIEYRGRQELFLRVPLRDVGEGEDGDENVTEDVPDDDLFVDELPDQVETSHHDMEQSNLQQDGNQICEDHLVSYTDEQRRAHDQIMSAVLMPSGDGQNFYGLVAPAGCGKTYLYKGLMLDCKRRGIQTVCCAMTALAAQLLPSADTCHRTFGIPVKARQDGTDRSFIERTSSDALSLQNAGLIVVDEVSMMSAWQATLIDCLLKDIMERDVLFGGKVVLFGGDMGQILPVLRNASPSQIVANSLHGWSHWSKRKEVSLTKNMRAKDDPEFAEWVMKVRDGSANIVGTDDIRVPSEMVVSASRSTTRVERGIQQRVGATSRDEYINAKLLVKETFGDDNSRFAEGIILSPTNDSTRFINHIVVQNLGETVASRSYLSKTTVIYQDRGQQDENALGEFLMSTEELENINASNLPPHRLHLKVGCIVMLLINLDKKQGLCNGTRFVVEKLLPNAICLKRLVPMSGLVTVVFLPRMKMRSDDVPVAGCIERYQFPICLAFAVSINKSQGQTFDYVGLFLRKPVFTYGQFYVAIGRGKKKEYVKICVIRGPRQGPRGGMRGGPSRLLYIITKNFVWKEGL